MTGAGRPAVFLDRDGTINAEVDFLRDPADLALLPGAAEAIARLAAAGFACVVITNQSGIARGYLDEATLAEIHARLRTLLAAEGAQLDGIYHCPHHPEIDSGAPCDCRKPLPGMLRLAAEEHDLDLSRSFVIGDSPRDLEAGLALGVPGFLVETGKSVDAAAHERYTVFADLPAAVDALLAARA